MIVEPINQIDRFRAFLALWRGQPAARLATFFARYAALKPAPVIVPARLPLDPERLQAVLAELRDPISAVRTSGGFLNPWAAAGLGSRELPNTAVLATMLDPATMGNLARDFLAELLERCGSQLGRAAAKERYHVRTEHCPAAQQSERIDLTIEGETFVLGIEVKIHAGEQPNQLARYRGSLARYAGTRKGVHLVFLAPYKSKTDTPVPHLTWSAVAGAARAVLRSVHRREFGFNHHLLDAFARHVRTHGD